MVSFIYLFIFLVCVRERFLRVPRQKTAINPISAFQRWLYVFRKASNNSSNPTDAVRTPRVRRITRRVPRAHTGRSRRHGRRESGLERKKVSRGDSCGRIVSVAFTIAPRSPRFRPKSTNGSRKLSFRVTGSKRRPPRFCGIKFDFCTN